MALKVYNQDCVGLIQRLDRFRFELVKSVSSGVSEMISHDAVRTNTYLSAFVAYLDWVVALPQLDLPESHPHGFDIADHPDAVVVESEIVNDIVRIMDVARIELSDSQSSRRASGLVPFDESRLRALIQKLQNFMNSYVASYTPLDLPESSPQADMSGAGRTGV